MALQKGFLRRSLLFSQVSLTRRFMGPFMGSLFAVSFYAFLYLLRDILRAMTNDPPEFFWDLSPEQIYFYNFIYAAVASLFGQSVCFHIWFNKSKISFYASRFHFIQIYHDHRYLLWFYLAGLLKLGFAYYIFFGRAFKGWHFIFSLYPDYNILFYLLIIVLFLNSWTSFRRLFPRQSFKWMSVSAIILTAFSFFLSQIDVIDQQAFRERVYSKSIYHQYDFDLPKAAYYETVHRKSIAMELVVVRDSGKGQPGYKILIDNQKVPADSLPVVTSFFLKGINEAERPLAFATAYIDKDLKINQLESIRKGLMKAGLRKIYYMVAPAHPEFDIRYYRNLGIEGGLAMPEYEVPPPHEAELAYSNALNNLKVSLPNQKVQRVFVNTDSLSESQLVFFFQNRLRQNPHSLIRYRYNPRDKFQNYVKVHSAALLSVQQLRNEEALMIYGKTYWKLNWEQRKLVRDKYSLSFIAVSAKPN